MAATRYALVFLASGPSVYLWRVSQLERRQRELEDKVAQRTAEVVRQKEEIEAQHVRLLALDGFKQGLMGMIVHDLKNPLGVILNVIESHSVQSQVSILRQSARQMLTMVLNILDVQKFEDTKMVLDTRDCGFRQLGEQALNQVRFLAGRKSIVLDDQIASDLAVRVDMEMIERVLVNLLTNAVKYTPSNGRIELIAREDPSGLVRAEVRDDGEGIPADKLDRVFDKFGQVKARSSGGSRSTGIGLTFCKLAVEGHGGQIGVTSELGRGTVFWLTLPAAVSSPAAGFSDAPPPAASTSTPEAGLTDADRALLGPLVTELRSLEIYRYSDLRRILARADFPSNERVDLWKKRLETAIEAEDEVVFEGLLSL